LLPVDLRSRFVLVTTTNPPACRSAATSVPTGCWTRTSAFRSLHNLDWPRTIRRNLKNDNQTVKTIIPEEISFFRRRHRQNEWNVIIAMDQSGSMSS
jgi:Mg-chelatase subunit ChlD